MCLTWEMESQNYCWGVGTCKYDKYLVSSLSSINSFPELCTFWILIPCFERFGHFSSCRVLGKQSSILQNPPQVQLNGIIHLKSPSGCLNLA